MVISAQSGVAGAAHWQNAESKCHRMQVIAWAKVKLEVQQGTLMANFWCNFNNRGNN